MTGTCTNRTSATKTFFVVIVIIDNKALGVSPWFLSQFQFQPLFSHICRIGSVMSLFTDCETCCAAVLSLDSPSIAASQGQGAPTTCLFRFCTSGCRRLRPRNLTISPDNTAIKTSKSDCIDGHYSFRRARHPTPFFMRVRCEHPQININTSTRLQLVYVF